MWSVGAVYDPAKTFFPSASVTLVAFARLEPSLAREPLTVTVSPIVIAFFVQPFLNKMAGAPSSISQLTIFPVASLASIKMRALGLIQSIFVTAPVRGTGFFRSYFAADE